MRIYNENTEDYIRALAGSIAKDPSSLEHWECMHIQLPPQETPDLSALERCRDEYRDIDCDIVVCPDRDVLLVSRHMPAELLDGFVAALTSGFAEIKLYDMFRDWRQVHALLEGKIAAVRPVAPMPVQMESAGEIRALLGAFAEAKNLRKGRHPQYIMVVEDDPMTRRLVTGAFKENYALIAVENAQDAIVNYLLHAPDIVFLDIGLPDINGLAVLRQIMASDPDAYVVMFSGNSYLDNVTTALNAGASGFIAKPFKKEKMRHYIEDSVAHHHKSLG